MNKNWWQYEFQWTRKAILLTPLIALISIITAGGGHGTQLPTLACYPSVFFFSIHESGGPLVWLVLLGQFPAYGLLIDIGRWYSRQPLAVGLVALLHLILVLIAIATHDF